MKFGLFLPTGTNGFLISTATPEFHPTFEYQKRLVQQAEELGFDFALSAVKYRGFPGPTQFWSEFLDSLTLTAGLLSVTERIKLYGSVSILTMPPPVVAKMCAQLSDIGGERFGLNIVTGWLKNEFTQMGIWPGDEYFNTRYAYAREYVTILRDLWDTGRSDFKGTYFQMEDCQMGLVPPHPVEVICAGSSPPSLSFTADLCDIAFLSGIETDEMVKQINNLRHASVVSGRDVKAFMSYFVIIRDTDDEAVAHRDEIRDGTDMVSILSMSGQTVANVEGGTADRFTRITDDRAFFNTRVICGSPQTVAKEFDDIAQATGADTVMLLLEDYMVDSERFAREVIPLLTTD